MTYGVALGAPEGDPDSEAIAFVGGAATISPMDGDWSTPEAARAGLEARLDDLWSAP